MAGKLQLVLPGLFDLPIAELAPGLIADELPALNRILRLSSRRPNSAFSIDAMLRQALALEAAADGEPERGLPLAQACAPQSLRHCRRLLLFQAVHLRPGLQNAVIFPVPRGHHDSDDINILINDLKSLFKVDCNISTIDESLFLMELKAFDAPSHYPHILSVLGKVASPYFEQAHQYLGWYKLLNEMQMFLHQHEVNLERERRGLLPINSLWFWGGGDLPEKTALDFAWYCDDSLLNRFAARLGMNLAPVDDLAVRGPSSDIVIVDLRLLELLKTGATTQLDQVLLDVDNRLLRPLLQRVDRERRYLRLRAGHEFDLELNPVAALKFWRRPRTLATWGRGDRET